MDMDVKVFAALTPEVSGRQAEIIFELSGLALGVAVAAGLLMARRRGEFAAVRTCAWFIALMLAAGILFILRTTFRVAQRATSFCSPPCAWGARQSSRRCFGERAARWLQRRAPCSLRSGR